MPYKKRIFCSICDHAYVDLNRFANDNDSYTCTMCRDNCIEDNDERYIPDDTFKQNEVVDAGN